MYEIRYVFVERWMCGGRTMRRKTISLILDMFMVVEESAQKEFVW